MEKTIKVSVAMATYNGACYIEEQLKSICLQTIKPDEIVISDDGSKDVTIDIVKRIASSEVAEGIDFKILRDNPRHGYCGNFEWALKHTSGDYIFLCDQDDIWLPTKVEKVLQFLKCYPKVSCVFHDASLIDKNNNPIKSGTFWLHRPLNMDVNQDGVFMFRREEFLEQIVSQPICNGMVMCVSKELVRNSIPFPKIKGFHDQWLTFCAIMEDSCYYLDQKLAFYRLHGQNMAGNPAYKGNMKDRIKKVYKRVYSAQLLDIDILFLGESMVKKLEENGLVPTSAYCTAKRLVEIGDKKRDAFGSNRIIGICKLCKLYITDVRYRRSGTKSFFTNCLVY